MRVSYVLYTNIISMSQEQDEEGDEDDDEGDFDPKVSLPSVFSLCRKCKS